MTPTTSTTAAPTTTTTVPPPYSFDGSVPPPPLENTGTDYEAIYRSINLYSAWILAHDPRTEHIPTLAFPKSDFEVQAKRTIGQLTAAKERYVFSGGDINRYEYRSTINNIVTFQVWYDDIDASWIRSDGSIRDHRIIAGYRENVVLAQSGDGHWRVFLVEQAAEAAP